MLSVTSAIPTPMQPRFAWELALVASKERPEFSLHRVNCRSTRWPAVMGTQRQNPVARELPLKVKRALGEDIGEYLTCSIGLAPNVFLSEIGSDLQNPDRAHRHRPHGQTARGFARPRIAGDLRHRHAHGRAV
jgi:hypothetical protein